MSAKLLIEPVINGKAHGSAVQAKKFSLDFRITNTGESPSDEFTISSIKLKSSEGQDLVDDLGRRQFFVGIINPSESITIKAGDTGQPMCGLVDVTLSATPRNEESRLVFLQKNPFTNEVTDLALNNRWVDFFYIKSTSNHLQERTNTLILWLTCITALLAIIQTIPIIEQVVSSLQSGAMERSMD